jgi:hypothetical protein
MAMKNQPKKLHIAVLSISFITHSYAGFHEFTMHSRANCGGFNESVSWHYNHSYNLITYSAHTNPKAIYSCNMHSGGWAITWRSAALHFAEGYGGWHVVGHHWITPDNGRSQILLSVTVADDCNIYDGWWDAK